MTKQFFWALVRRFLRAGVAGGIASALAVLASNNLDLSSLESFTNWLGIILVAFVTGFLTAIEKFMRFDKTKFVPIALICVLVGSIFTLGCSRRIAVVQPEGVQVIVDDRVTDLWKAEDRMALNAFAGMIQRLPAEQQKDAIVEFLKVYDTSIESRERVATMAIQREKEAGLNWLQVLKEVLAFGGLAYSAAK